MNIYVGNLPFSATEADLRSLFADYGDITSAAVITDRDTGQSAGSASSNSPIRPSPETPSASSTGMTGTVASSLSTRPAPGRQGTDRRRNAGRVTVLNPLDYGALCVVTTRDRQVLTGRFLGVEVAHGDRSILVESHSQTHSIPVESVFTTSGPRRRAA